MEKTNTLVEMKKTKMQELGTEYGADIFQLVYAENQPLDFFLRSRPELFQHLLEELRPHLNHRPKEEEALIFVKAFQSELRRLADLHEYPYTITNEVIRIYP